MTSSCSPSLQSTGYTRMNAVPSHLSHELGLHALRHAGRDVHLLIFLRILRCFCFGIIGLIFALYFSALGIDDPHIGLFMTLTVLGDVLLSLLLTFVADAWGRRSTLLLGAVLMVLSGVTFALTEKYWVLLVAAVVGVVSPGGGEIGPFRAIEESCIAHLVHEEDRTKVFAWYVVLAMGAAALGLASGGAFVEALRSRGWSDVDSYRSTFWIYVVCGILMAFAVLTLSKSCEIHDRGGNPDVVEDNAVQRLPDESAPLFEDHESHRASFPAPNGDNRVSIPRKSVSERSKRNHPLSRDTLPLLFILCLLFSLDSLASGIMPWSLLNLYLSRTFQQLTPSSIGTLMAISTALMAVGTLISAPLARRTGLIPAMIATHLPSSIFLALTPFSGSLGLTLFWIYARALLNTGDQAPRSAFLSQVVDARERTAVMGIVNVARNLSQSVGPSVTGWLAGNKLFWVAFVLAGGLKVAYDIVLVALFYGWDRMGRGKGTAAAGAHEGADDTDGERDER